MDWVLLLPFSPFLLLALAVLWGTISAYRETPVQKQLRLMVADLAAEAGEWSRTRESSFRWCYTHAASGVSLSADSFGSRNYRLSVGGEGIRCEHPRLVRVLEGIIRASDKREKAAAELAALGSVNAAFRRMNHIQ
jgi:hypothetical protein